MKRKIKQSKLKPKKRIYRKRNPKLDEIPLTNEEISNLLYELETAITYGNARGLCNAINLINIGGHCSDCDKIYCHCACEYCEDCELNRCLCKYDLTRRKILKLQEAQDEVRKISWNFAKEYLNKQQLDKLINNIALNLEYHEMQYLNLYILK